MRENRFRALDEYSDMWVYGQAFFIDSDNDQGYISNGISRHHAVRKKTVGQFTGLYVWEKKEVYEGDIIDFTVFDCFDNDRQYQGVVVYTGSRFMLWKSPDDEYYDDDGGFDLDWVLPQDAEAEIIGNIHDNPELMEQK